MIKIPAVIPIIVVNANPLSIPTPAQSRGNIAAKIVKKAPTIMKNALLILTINIYVSKGYPQLSSLDA